MDLEQNATLLYPVKIFPDPDPDQVQRRQGMAASPAYAVTSHA